MRGILASRQMQSRSTSDSRREADINLPKASTLHAKLLQTIVRCCKSSTAYEIRWHPSNTTTYASRHILCDETNGPCAVTSVSISHSHPIPTPSTETHPDRSGTTLDKSPTSQHTSSSTNSTKSKTYFASTPSLQQHIDLPKLVLLNLPRTAILHHDFAVTSSLKSTPANQNPEQPNPSYSQPSRPFSARRRER